MTSSIERTARLALAAALAAGWPVSADGDPAVVVAQAPGETPAASAAAPAAPPVAPAVAPPAAEPGWFALPVGGGELRISGYAKLDAIYDLGAAQGYYIDVPHIPLAGSADAARRGVASLSARESRLVVESRNRRGAAELRTFLEADFLTGDGGETQTNSTRLRLRRYYGSYGPLLAGQNWSAFMDLDAIPDTVDHEGPSGQIFIRQPQLRITLPVANGGQLALAIENPSPDFQPAPSAAHALAHWPDATGRLTLAGRWGHLSVSGVVRELRSDDGAGHAGAAIGYGVGVAGSLALGDDRLLYELNAGRGLGRYVLDLAGYGARWNGIDRVTAIPAWGGFAAFEHHWAATIRSTILYSETRVYDPITADPTFLSLMTPAANRRTQSLHLNLFWDITDRMEVGVEYSRGQRETVDGGTGIAARLQLGIRFYLVPRH